MENHKVRLCKKGFSQLLILNFRSLILVLKRIFDRHIFMMAISTKDNITMKKLFIFIVLWLNFPTYAVCKGEHIRDNPNENNGQVIHIREVFKTVDTFKLKIDIFYTSQSLEKENNTAIVFFHGGGWAFGTPEEFFSTCERTKCKRVRIISTRATSSSCSFAWSSKSSSPIYWQGTLCGNICQQ